jgi:hypothetical protein
MRIDYTDHARLRMAMRGVTEAEVRETIESPDAIWPGEIGAEEIAVRSYGKLRKLRYAVTAIRR